MCGTIPVSYTHLDVYKRQIQGRTTGTNADEVTITRGGVRTEVVSVPLRYMHTPVEVVELSDVEAVGALIADYLVSHDWSERGK